MGLGLGLLPAAVLVEGAVVERVLVLVRKQVVLGLGLRLLEEALVGHRGVVLAREHVLAVLGYYVAARVQLGGRVVLEEVASGCGGGGGRAVKEVALLV